MTGDLDNAKPRRPQMVSSWRRRGWRAMPEEQAPDPLGEEAVQTTRDEDGNRVAAATALTAAGSRSWTPPPTVDRIMDRSEARRKWRIRLVIVGVLIVGAAIWNAIGITGSIADYGVAFGAEVQSQQCSNGRCSVDLQYTQPNGEVITSDHYDGVKASRIHVRPNGTRYMTLYWFSSDDTTDKDNPFWSDIAGGVGSDLVIGLVIFAVLFSARDIRRQAKRPAPGMPLA
jgi:hypothetical protein